MVEPSFADAMRFLGELARDVVEASRVRPGESVGRYGPNTTGGTLIRPGGRDCYPAFWIRDFAMSLESGLVHPDELAHAVALTARLQASEDLKLPSGSRVPKGSIADHITFDGKPIFFPGTIDDHENQGGPWGKWPSLDDHFFLVEMAWHHVIVNGARDMITRPIDGISLIDRLEMAFTVPPTRDDSQLVWCDESNRGVSFGFVDSIVHTGELLFCSLLRYRAATRLAEMFSLIGDMSRSVHYGSVADAIARHIPAAFADGSGLLRASTRVSNQPDVWGTAFAIYTGVLGEKDARAASQALAQAYVEGTIAWRGNIRHVPTDRDFSGATAWEQTIGRQTKNRYQNGAYWGTATGWVCYAIAQVAADAAMALAQDYLGELREGDFRQGATFGSPFECMHPAGDYRQNAVYMTSVTCPLAAFRRLDWIPGGPGG